MFGIAMDFAIQSHSHTYEDFSIFVDLDPRKVRSKQIDQVESTSTILLHLRAPFLSLAVDKLLMNSIHKETIRFYSVRESLLSRSFLRSYHGLGPFETPCLLQRA
jgi:hypothetical protein